MRYIDIERLRPLLPAQWEQRAQAALDAVRAVPPEHRTAELERRAGLWRELANVLAELSHRKCWYCESRQSRSDNAVDHFRPKGRVAERRDHEGYWWLAFDWRNYRYSCTFCNSHRRSKREGTTGGKQDHFPLLDEGARALQETDDLGRERPELLDPASEIDPPVLWFNDEGRAEPRWQKEEHSIEFRRAQTSIGLYYLNHPDIVQDRVELYRQIRRWVKAGSSMLAHPDSGNPDSGHTDQARQALAEMMDERAQYSMAAHDMIRGLRDNSHKWIDNLERSGSAGESVGEDYSEE